jgi:putative membrane protein
MITDLLIRYFHFLGIFVVFAAVLGQHLLLRGTVPRSIIAKAQRFDIAYAIAVVIVLGTGLLQWFSGAKPAVFYSSNPVFHTKLTLFLVIGLVSIYPSVFMGKQKKGDPAELVAIPKGLVHSIRLELLLLVVMPLLAVIMAKGLGIPVAKP